MKNDPIVVEPSTPTLEALQLMREKQIGCLPVVKEGRLVGLITERNFISIASDMVEQRLKAGAYANPCD
jgi:CBS domain-containing protein